LLNGEGMNPNGNGTTSLSLGSAGYLHVTDSAQTFMKRMIRFGGQGPGAAFRLLVSPGGCSGLSSAFSVETAPQEGDVTFTLGAMTLLIPAATFPALSSVIIDFADTPTQAGLVLVDPKPSSCATEPHKGDLVTLT
jgi:iron-sulfur cluster assembly accessory protein